MVDVIEAAEPDADVATPNPTLSSRLRRPSPEQWAKYAPLLLVAFAVAFSAWSLRDELRVALYPNDSTVHLSMVRLVERRIRAGHNPLDSWFSYLGLGAPNFTQYQALSHLIAGTLSVALGDWVFRWSSYLLVCTWPISVYIGARLFGLDRWQAASAALFSPMLVNVTGYGYEWGSFVWLGSGMWSMLWALWLLPIAWGLSWRAVTKGERLALATFVVGLTCALHFLTGYLVLLSLGVFVVVRPPQALKRLGRGAIVGVGGLLIFAFVFVPTLSQANYVNLDSFQVGTFWQNSYGPGKVFGWLFRGEVFDFGRWPIVSLFVAVGVVVCVVRARRQEWARGLLGVFALSLALYSGRSVVGFFMNRLPGGKDILLHRFITGVHLSGMMIAGVGAAWVFGRVVALARHLIRTPRRGVIAVAIAVVLAGVVLYPVVKDRKQYADANSSFMKGQIAADKVQGQDIAYLIAIAKARNDGRLYAGGSNNWGAQNKLDQVPVYQQFAQRDADSVGFYLRTLSLSSDIEPYFNDADPAQYDLFNVKYVLLPITRRPSVAANFVTQKGDEALWEVPTSGYLEVVDTTEAVGATRSNMADTFGPYLSSPAVAQFRHPLVSFDGAKTPPPSTSASAPYEGAPGSVDWSNVSLDDGRFTGQVQASRPAWVMLKETYSPNWTALVDGRPVKPQMLAPSYVGVPIPAGTHVVVFKYRAYSHYTVLFIFGALVLLVIALGPWAWRRYRRRRLAPPAAEPDPEPSEDVLV